MVKWQHLAIAALLILCLLVQYTRLLQVENQLAVLTDTVQRQELKMKELDKLVEPLLQVEKVEPTYEELARKYLGYLDDDIISGLLKEE